MTDDVLFTERQRFTQWWLLLIVLAINGIFLFGVGMQLVGGVPFGERPMDDVGLVITTVAVLLLTLLFFSFRLDTTIKQDGIYVRFFPFHRKFRRYTWDRLTKIFVRRYSPLWEYGGWGLRWWFFGKGTAFNVSGNEGLQLEFSEGKKLLIGTQKPEELTEVLNRIGQLRS